MVTLRDRMLLGMSAIGKRTYRLGSPDLITNTACDPVAARTDAMDSWFGAHAKVASPEDLILNLFKLKTISTKSFAVQLWIIGVGRSPNSRPSSLYK